MDVFSNRRWCPTRIDWSEHCMNYRSLHCRRVLFYFFFTHCTCSTPAFSIDGYNMHACFCLLAYTPASFSNLHNKFVQLSRSPVSVCSVCSTIFSYFYIFGSSCLYLSVSLLVLQICLFDLHATSHTIFDLLGFSCLDPRLWIHLCRSSHSILSLDPLT